MKMIVGRSMLFLGLLLTSCIATMAQTSTGKDLKIAKTKEMKTYVIERELPGAGDLTGEQLKAVSQKSCSVLKDLGPSIQWLQSYVTANKLFCVYKAENEELIREHAKKGGFPCNKITEVENIISPATAQ